MPREALAAALQVLPRLNDRPHPRYHQAGAALSNPAARLAE